MIYNFAFKFSHKTSIIQNLTIYLIRYNGIDEDFLARSSQKLTNVKIKATGSVEDEDDALIVDFANKYLGGGVMGKFSLF